MLRGRRENNNGVALAIIAENVIPSNRADETEMARLIGFPALHSEAAVFEAPPGEEKGEESESEVR